MLEHVSTLPFQIQKKHVFFLGVFQPPDHEDFSANIREMQNPWDPWVPWVPSVETLPRLRTLPVQVHSLASQGMDDFGWPGHQEVFPWVENG